MQNLNVNTPSDYFQKLFNILSKTSVIAPCPHPNTDAPNYLEPVEYGIHLVLDYLIENHRNHKKIMAIGNGGSAAIAMHTLADYANAGGLRTMDFNGPSLLTCMANDYGYENVFAKPIGMFAESGDMLFAISSSGKSPNIINACEMAHERSCKVVTFSGFDADNPLRRLGHINFHVPSTHYGFVELVHQALLHCILDLFIKKFNIELEKSR